MKLDRVRKELREAQSTSNSRADPTPELRTVGNRAHNGKIKLEHLILFLSHPTGPFLFHPTGNQRYQPIPQCRVSPRFDGVIPLSESDANASRLMRLTPDMVESERTNVVWFRGSASTIYLCQ